MRKKINHLALWVGVYTVYLTFIIPPSEGSSEGATSSRLPVWDLFQIYQGIGKRLSVHMEQLASLSVLPRSGQHQSQLKQEHMQPLTEEAEGKLNERHNFIYSYLP